MLYEYIETPEHLDRVLERLAELPLIAVDTEAAGYHRYLDSISLLQISSREENFLIDPIALDDLSGLRPILEDEKIETIFHDADFDLRILDRDLQLRVAGLFDTQIAAAFLGERALGLGALVERYLGIKLPKAYQRADWAERPLSEGMKDYAATDTVHLPALRDKLRTALEEKGRLAWAEEEFARREETRWSVTADQLAGFMRIKGARDLTGRGLAILREIFDWREEVARERDQAAFRVLANKAMIEIGLRAPANRDELMSITGVSDRMADRSGADLLEAVKRGEAVVDDELPRFPPSKRWDRDPESEARGERLRGVRNRLAAELDLDPGFLMSRAVLDEIARRNPASIAELENLPDIRRWQIVAIGEPLMHALRSR
ncbi:MAG TPA: HRDC domain-containing protein [Longimicrobiaceae bacterium]|nr:HRDC domain-containing protein [Longimicrobiaceae bacterium]